jgi:hypothetical protein
LALNGLLWLYFGGMTYSGLRRSAMPHDFWGAMAMFCVSGLLFFLVIALRWERTWQVCLAVAYGLCLATMAILPPVVSTGAMTVEDFAALGVAVVTIIPAYFRLMALRCPPGGRPSSALGPRGSSQAPE